MAFFSSHLPPRNLILLHRTRTRRTHALCALTYAKLLVWMIWFGGNSPTRSHHSFCVSFSFSLLLLLLQTYFVCTISNQFVCKRVIGCFGLRAFVGHTVVSPLKRKRFFFFHWLVAKFLDFFCDFFFQNHTAKPMNLAGTNGSIQPYWWTMQRWKKNTRPYIEYGTLTLSTCFIIMTMVKKDLLKRLVCPYACVRACVPARVPATYFLHALVSQTASTS